MRKILVIGLMIAGFGAAAAVADTTETCSIRAGRTEGKMAFSSERGDCVSGPGLMRPMGNRGVNGFAHDGKRRN